WWSRTTGTWTRADTAGASPRSRPRGRPRPDLVSDRALRRWSRGRRRWRRWFWPQQAALRRQGNEPPGLAGHGVAVQRADPAEADLRRGHARLAQAAFDR